MLTWSAWQFLELGNEILKLRTLLIVWVALLAYVIANEGPETGTLFSTVVQDIQAIFGISSGNGNGDGSGDPEQDRQEWNNELKALRNQLASIKDEISRMQQDLEQRNAKQLLERIERVKDNAKGLQRRLNEVKTLITQRTGTLEDAEQAAQDLKDEVGNVKPFVESVVASAESRSEEDIANIEQRVQDAKETIENKRDTLDAIDNRANDISSEHDKVTMILSEAIAALRSARDDHTRVESEANNIRTKVDNDTEELESFIEEYKSGMLELASRDFPDAGAGLPFMAMIPARQHWERAEGKDAPSLNTNDHISAISSVIEAMKLGRIPNGIPSLDRVPAKRKPFPWDGRMLAHAPPLNNTALSSSRLPWDEGILKVKAQSPSDEYSPGDTDTIVVKGGEAKPVALASTSPSSSDEIRVLVTQPFTVGPYDNERGKISLMATSPERIAGKHLVVHQNGSGAVFIAGQGTDFLADGLNLADDSNASLVVKDDSGALSRGGDADGAIVTIMIDDGDRGKDSITSVDIPLHSDYARTASPFTC